ncbi:MAG: isoprenylcysteine carboxylmethyltransferase family protein [Pseudomonadota bacterium]
MIEKFTLAGTIVFTLTFLIVIVRAIVARQHFIGQPSVPVPFFVLGKSLAFISVSFLPLRGLNVGIGRVYSPLLAIDIIALFILFAGISIVIISAIQLNQNLIFGLSTSDSHCLQTRGLFSVSRHPFYMGFLLIVVSSCLLMPNVINIISLIVSWIIHHFIMINEEKHLQKLYGFEYKQYANRVNRYLTLFNRKKSVIF